MEEQLRLQDECSMHASRSTTVPTLPQEQLCHLRLERAKLEVLLYSEVLRKSAIYPADIGKPVSDLISRVFDRLGFRSISGSSREQLGHLSMG